MQNLPGFPTTPSAVESLRDPSSGEIRWEAGGEFHDYVDATALNAKLQTVENMGVTDISVWSLGGEPWFTGESGLSRPEGGRERLQRRVLLPGHRDRNPPRGQ